MFFASFHKWKICNNLFDGWTNGRSLVGSCFLVPLLDILLGDPVTNGCLAHLLNLLAER